MGGVSYSYSQSLPTNLAVVILPHTAPELQMQGLLFRSQNRWPSSIGGKLNCEIGGTWLLQGSFFHIRVSLHGQGSPYHLSHFLWLFPASSSNLEKKKNLHKIHGPKRRVSKVPQLLAYGNRKERQREWHFPSWSTSGRHPAGNFSSISCSDLQKTLIMY